MDKLKLLTKPDLKALLRKKPGESRFGEHIQLLSNSTPIYEQLLSLDVSHAIIGIPETIGSFAQNGRMTSGTIWMSSLKCLVNTQSNQFNNPAGVAVIGYLDFSEEEAKLVKLDPTKPSDRKKAMQLVVDMDNQVTKLIHDVVKAGIKPIVIGGGHNNAYGLIKGHSLAQGKSVNAINFDAHADFKHDTGRHNGNGFSYAFNDGFLDRYCIFGLHENHISQKTLDILLKLKKKVKFSTFEELFVRKTAKFRASYQESLRFVQTKPFGIELDVDCIKDFPALATSPSGFSTNQIRELIHAFGQHKNAAYLHICGASPGDAPKKHASKWPRLIALFISDYLKSHAN